MKGMILAGGAGSRLYPATISVCKQLLPIYDKPMIYYPLSTFMQAGIRNILIISTPEDTGRFEKLFGDGSHLGLSLQYVVQPQPRGLAEAFIVGADFIGSDAVALILGDNIFYGQDLPSILQEGISLQDGGLVLGYQVKDPNRYGVVHFDSEMRPLDIEEKPQYPKSSYAIPGLYFYGPDVVDIAKSLQPSARGELEITDVNRVYLKEGRLTLRILGRGNAWLDTGTFDALQQACSFVQAIQERQGIKIGCIEEIAYQMGYIRYEQLLVLADRCPNNEYGQYLKSLQISATDCQKTLRFALGKHG